MLRKGCCSSRRATLLPQPVCFQPAQILQPPSWSPGAAKRLWAALRSPMPVRCPLPSTPPSAPVTSLQPEGRPAALHCQAEGGPWRRPLPRRRGCPGLPSHTNSVDRGPLSMCPPCLAPPHSSTHILHRSSFRAACLMFAYETFFSRNCSQRTFPCLLWWNCFW